MYVSAVDLAGTKKMIMIDNNNSLINSLGVMCQDTPYTLFANVKKSLLI